MRTYTYEDPCSLESTDMVTLQAVAEGSDPNKTEDYNA